ncbi:fibrinogen-like YCDxxxxGGGW domain-containing protein [Microbacterium sp. M3]|uniref:Fibrinogen-like YCDxxxxGGGW domain-containing protein n=1 Tax=Microbacterium arthrosphaerae TaxID=792652 RepID=A0ABU4H2N6_9MICO|nr:MULTISPECIES: fibrinogen-like YCDxxxxGGGW domain-containing protein [Microbacterium]MDW4573602.1 fibrinogen-like YCDxxxxGGGW domain-containing protein [Microbacterium arthrosphaerae]MDW7607457.1 fibrinogen-like YCDxxxxGGGW domain-containing protein [Microbacterium sp. M3]
MNEIARPDGLHSLRTTTRRRHRLIVAAAIAVAALVGSLSLPVTATAADPLPDGKTEATAAGSCWEVKQNYPASTNGVYWLQTPTLVYPQQFYCDQESEGGGWVLIARGREGWKNYYQGLQSAATIANTPSGTAAFQVAQLPSLTIDGLLNKGRVDALADGIRVRRATNVAGSTWQEARFKMVVRDRWVWTFNAEHRVGTWRFGTTNGSGGLTSNFGNNTSFNRIDTTAKSTHNWLAGWGYGNSVTGQNAATSYLWTPNNNQAGAFPFTQLFLRPTLRLADMNFGSIPDGGAPATTVSAIPDSDAMRTVWGVSGSGNGATGELNTEVAAFGEMAGKVYVGGNFRYVQRTQAGSGQVEQPFVAAFDIATGEWISTFRPALDGQVKAINALPDGRLALGGQFATVNGAPQPGIAFVNPATGALTGQQVVVENRTTGGVPYVRDLDVQGNLLYVAGSFTHLTRAGSASSASTWNGGRVALATSTPDVDWNAFLNGTTVSVDASAQGDRAYYSGYFKMKENTKATSGTALQTGAGAALTVPQWNPTFSKSSVDASGNITGNVWQLGVIEAGDQVWLGGSEHSMFSYNRSNFALTSGSITKAGGDFQAVAAGNGLVYGGCHCGDFVYQDAYAWSNVGTNWTQADKISLFGAWDAQTHRYVHEFSPIVTARAGYGVWGLFVDSTGVVWAGGDISRTIRSGFINQWSGGFARFAPRDSAAPTRPGPVSVAITGGGTRADLTWSPSSDPGGVTYEVLRGNRVIASTTSTAFTVPATATATKYFVRARDAGGNRSASTAAVTVKTAADTFTTFIPNGAQWSYRFSSDPLPTDWASVGFDDSSWAGGNGVLARGVAGAATNIDPTALSPRPLSAQFRHEFTVTDAATVADGTVTVIANDGVIVYLNGVELGRTRMPAGAITQNTYATSVVTHAAAAASRVTYAVPAGMLVSGTNVIAASAHANYRSTPDMSFDLSFVAERGAPAAPPGPVSGLTATDVTQDSVTLNWSAPSTGGPVASYAVSRDGAGVASVPASQLSWTDGGLTADTTYVYRVVAVGAGGSSAAATVQVHTPAVPDPGEPPVVIENGATWSYRYSSDPLPADWTAIPFDDSAWASGNGLLARGVAGAATNIDPTGLTTKPLSAQFRKSFAVVDAAGVADGTVTVIANDGVIVYLNGVELGRTRLPAGTITQNSYATAVVSNATAVASRSTFAVPAALLVEGENVISASTHANYRSTPDLSFDLALNMPR